MFSGSDFVIKAFYGTSQKRVLLIVIENHSNCSSDTLSEARSKKFSAVPSKRATGNIRSPSSLGTRSQNVKDGQFCQSKYHNTRRDSRKSSKVFLLTSFSAPQARIFLGFNTLKHVFTSENQRCPSAFTLQIHKSFPKILYI